MSSVKRKSFCSTQMVGTACSKEALSLREGGKYAETSQHGQHHSGAGPRPGRAPPPSLLHVVDDGQDAHLLLGRVNILILLLGHARAETIEPPTVLGIINTVLKK